MGNRAIWAMALVLAAVTAACGSAASSAADAPTSSAVAAPPSVVGVGGASVTPVSGSPAAEGAIVAGNFQSGRMQLMVTGAPSVPADLPNLSQASGAPGSTGIGAGYQWYEEGDTGVAVKIRFPSDPVSSGPTTGLPTGTGIQVEFDLLASAGDLYSSSNGECTLSFDQNDATALRGRFDCHGIPGSEDPAKTIDASGTFEAQP